MDATTMIIGLLFVIIIAMWVDLLAQRFSWWDSLLGKVAGWKQIDLELPWYARSGTSLPSEIPVTATYTAGVTATSSEPKAALKFDLAGVLTAIGKNKFVADDVDGGALSTDGKHVTVTIESPTAAPSTPKEQIATVTLPDSVLLLVVSVASTFTVTAATGSATTASLGTGGDIAWSVSLQIGESDNEVPIDSDTFAAATTAS